MAERKKKSHTYVYIIEFVSWRFFCDTVQCTIFVEKKQENQFPEIFIFWDKIIWLDFLTVSFIHSWWIWFVSRRLFNSFIFCRYRWLRILRSLTKLDWFPRTKQGVFKKTILWVLSWLTVKENTSLDSGVSLTPS